MNRKQIIAGNWKMHKTLQEAEETVATLANMLSNSKTEAEVFIAAPFPFLFSLISRFGNTHMQFGAQNISEHAKGAYTGEVSAAMLRSVDAFFTLVGHSERRQYFQETDHKINEKIKQALAEKLEVILCCGETLEMRKTGKHFDVVVAQLQNALQDIRAEQMQYIHIAYEPVWAIGTGETASPDQAQEMHACIRALLHNIFGGQVAMNTRILYGGSVKPENAGELFSMPDIDGGLIGGASLQAGDLMKIIDSSPHSTH
ncbi:MAG: triose-phosphate isomerase [Chitinophagales bacterium]